MKPWNPEHPHHAVWREYTKSLMDNKPKVVENNLNGTWNKTDDPSWHTGVEYRIARPMLKLSYEVPMPVTEPLEDWEVYWLAGDGENPSCLRWKNCDADNFWLRAGLIYSTEADAKAAIEAPNAAVIAALGAAK